MYCYRGIAMAQVEIAGLKVQANKLGVLFWMCLVA